MKQQTPLEPKLSERARKLIHARDRQKGDNLDFSGKTVFSSELEKKIQNTIEVANQKQTSELKNIFGQTPKRKMGKAFRATLFALFWSLVGIYGSAEYADYANANAAPEVQITTTNTCEVKTKKSS